MSDEDWIVFEGGGTGIERRRYAQKMRAVSVRIKALKHCLTFCHLKEGADPFDTYWLARIEIAGRIIEELRKAEKDAGLPLTYPEELPLKWPLSIHR